MLCRTNIFYLCHTLLKLLTHPVHCPVAIPNNHSRLWPQIKTKSRISTQKFPEMRWSSIIEDAVCRMFTTLLPIAPIWRILKRYAHSRVCPHVCTGTLPFLPNYSVNNLHHTLSKCGITVNTQLIRMWKEAVIVWLDVLSSYGPTMTERNRENP